MDQKSREALIARMRDARIEMCKDDECECITIQEHQANLARAARAQK